MNKRSLLRGLVVALTLTTTATGVEVDAARGGGPSSGSRPGGSWQGGGGGQGGGSWQGGSGWHGGGSGWHGGHPGVWRGGVWRGGWWGPNVGLSFGLPAFWGWPYYDLGWSTSVPVLVSPAPVFSVIPSPVAPAPATVWYYCTEPAGYFPYVQSCDRAWIPVLPSSVTPAFPAPVQ